MKRIPLHPALVLFVISASLFLSSCSKDAVISPAQPDPTSMQDVSALRLGNWGAVTGTIVPLKGIVRIEITDGNFKSSEFYLTKDGKFRVDNVPPGVYRLIIYYQRQVNVVIDTPVTNPYETFTHTVSGIRVSASETTDVGYVFL
jgi:hypothetical protein